MERYRDDPRRSERLKKSDTSSEKYSVIARKLLGMLNEKERKSSTQHECDDFLKPTTSTEHDLWKEVVSNWPDNLEGEMNKQFYDIVIFHSRNDEAEIQEFINYLKVLAKPETLTIALYNRNWKADLMTDNFDFFLFQPNISSSLIACSYGLVFLSKEFCQSVWPELSSIDFFRNALYNKAKKLIFPVMPKDARSADFTIPMGLRQLTKIQYYKKDETLEDMLKKVLTTIIQRTKKMKEEHFTLQCIYDSVHHLARNDIEGPNHVRAHDSYKAESSLRKKNYKDDDESHDQVFTHQRSVFCNHEVPSAGTGRREHFERQVGHVGEENINKKTKLSVASNDFSNPNRGSGESISSQMSESSDFDSLNSRESASLKSSFLVHKQGPVEVNGFHIPTETATAWEQEDDDRPLSHETGHKCIPQQLNSPLKLENLPSQANGTESEQFKIYNIVIKNVDSIYFGDSPMMDNKTENQDPLGHTSVNMSANTKSQNNNFARSKLEDDNSNLTKDCGPSRQNVSSKSELDECTGNLDFPKLKKVQEDNLECPQNPPNETKIAALNPLMFDNESCSLNENDDFDFSITHVKTVYRGSDESSDENEYTGVKTTCVKRIEDSDMFSRETKQQNSDFKRISSGGVVEEKQDGPNERMSQPDKGHVENVKKCPCGYWSNMNERKRKPLEQSQGNRVVGRACPIRSNDVAPVMVPRECSYSNNGCNDDDDDDDDNDIFNELSLSVDENTAVKTVSFANETAVKEIN